MISLNNVHKVYPPEQPALRHINLVVDEGEFVFVAGASGAGKSTLLKMMFGGETATSGAVNVAGHDLAELSTKRLQDLRQDIGVVFQEYRLLPRRTVRENVAFGLEIQGIDRRDREALAHVMLDALGLSDKGDNLPRMLSGGEQQRVAVARALLPRPKIILADEPTGNLDAEMSRVVFDLLIEANKQGVTVVVATHNLAIIEDLNKRTLVLDRGRIIGDFETPQG